MVDNEKSLGAGTSQELERLDSQVGVLTTKFHLAGDNASGEGRALDDSRQAGLMFAQANALMTAHLLLADVASAMGGEDHPDSRVPSIDGLINDANTEVTIEEITSAIEQVERLGCYEELSSHRAALTKVGNILNSVKQAWERVAGAGQQVQQPSRQRSVYPAELFPYPAASGGDALNQKAKPASTTPLRRCRH